MSILKPGHLAALAAAALIGATAAPVFAQTPGGGGPADKKDSGSLSSGQKESMPSTRRQGENAPTGGTRDAVTPDAGSGTGASSGSSSGEGGAGSGTVPGTRKGTGTSDPVGTPR